MKKYAKKLMLMLLMLGMLVTVLPADTFAEENAANAPAEEKAVGNLSIKVPFRPLENNQGIADWEPIAGAVVRLTNNQTGEVIEYVTIKADPNGDGLEQQGALNKTIPVGEYKMELVSVPEEYQDRFDWPDPKTITVKKGGARGDGFNLEELLRAKFTFIYEDENGDKHPIPNGNIELINYTGTYKYNISTDENGVAPNDGSHLKMVPWGYFINFDFDNDSTFKKFSESGLYEVKKNLYLDAKQTEIDKNDRLASISAKMNPFEVTITAFKLEAKDAKKHTPIISDEVVEKGGKVDLTDNVSNLKDLPAGTKVEDITEAGKINTNVPGQYTGKIKITYPDGSSIIKEVKVIVKGDAKKYNPIVSDEVVEKGGKIDLTDNVSNLKDLPQGTKVEDITEAGKINTNVPGEYVGKIKITYPDGSSLIKEVKVLVKDNHEDGPVIDNGENIVSTRNNRRPLFPWLELGKYESYGNEASKEVPKETMIHSAYIKGYPDGTVKADGNVTRAEAVTMLVRLKGYNVAVANNDLYSDVKSGDWFSPYIDAAYKAGILEEKTGESFRPNEAITRAELAQLISYVDNKNDAKSPFADAKSHKFEKAIDQAYGNKRIEGYEDGNFRPDNKITRAEIAKILNSLFDRKVNQEGLNDLYIDTFKDLNKGHWGYYDILEASLGHEFFKDGNSNEEWTKLIK